MDEKKLIYEPSEASTADLGKIEETVALIQHDRDLSANSDTIHSQDDGELLEETSSVQSRKNHIRKRQRARQYAISCLTVLKAIGLFFLPSFLSNRLTSKPPNLKPLRPTAFLDGMRGVASWAVFNSHTADLTYQHPRPVWEPHSHRTLFKLPIIRLVYKGDFAVALFFVISGFALSISPITNMRKSPRDPITAYAKLSSAILRRPIRLMIPSWASTTLSFILVRFDVYGRIFRSMKDPSRIVPNAAKDFHKLPSRYSSFQQQLFELINYNARLLRVFWSNPPFKQKYNSVLWTLKTEFQGSLILYLTHAALYPMRRQQRIAILIFLILFGVIFLHARDVPLFWAGHAIAEFSQLTPQETLALPKRRSLRLAFQIAAWLGFFFGCFFASMKVPPAKDTLFHSWTQEIAPVDSHPNQDYYTGLGACIIIFFVRYCPLALKFYDCSVVQYFGKLSYSLYIVHWWILKSFGCFVFYHVWRMTGKESFIQKVTGWLIGYIINFSIIVWLSDIFMRAVEVPSVELGQWVEQRLFTALKG